MKFLFDENLPRGLSDALASLKMPCEHVEQHGLTSTPDPDIFKFCRDNDYVLVSADLRIHRDKTEKAALEQAGIGVVEVSIANAKLNELALEFMRRADEMTDLLELSPPFHYQLTRRGLRTAVENEKRKRRKKKTKKR